MKRKESWRRAVIVLGITFVFGGITGENIPQVVCANPYYDPLVQDIDVPSEVCSELYEMVTDYLNSGEDGNKKKLVKKLKKQDDDFVKQWLSDYVIANYETDLKNVSEIADIYEQAYSDDENCAVWENISELCQEGTTIENKIATLNEKSGSAYLDVDCGWFLIWEEINRDDLVDLDVILDEYKDYLDLDGYNFYLASDSDTNECVVMTKNKFNDQDNQLIWYCTDQDKTLSYMSEGSEWIESLYIQLDVDNSDQNLTDMKVNSLEGKLQSIWYNIRYKLEGKTTADAFEGDYMFPASSKRWLQEDDLLVPEITGDDLIVGANEICARHGMIFKSSEWKTYFEQKNWYEGTIDPADFDGKLSKLEQENINFLCYNYRLFSDYSATIDDYKEAWGEGYNDAYGNVFLADDWEDSDNTADTYNDDSDNSNDTEENTCYVINCEESITMWESPDISSPEICQIPLGTAVNVLQGVPNGFVQVDYEGMTGFCLGSYLSEIQ